ncbi:MAG: SDR family oxidoreductase [Cyclobacteriaceae bacterium]|nr:SDR family oxidoreductase [Cyclobacteriaceae bacterium]MCH8516036.1 SDR family oxidoreductase [Cyclobacteriaceae bacterium]
MRLKDKVSLITGGASGLGKGIAEEFSKQGSKVIIADLNTEKGEEVAKQVGGVFFHLDVTDYDAVKSVVDKIEGQFGRIDVLVNNAGIDGEQKVTHESSLDNWHKVNKINLDGFFYVLKETVGLMLRQDKKGGSVINMASTAGMVGFPNIAPYSASKAAVINLSKSTAVEYGADNIRVNALAPTAILTDLVQHFIDTAADPEAMKNQLNSMNVIPGMPQVEDVAHAAVFLASDESRYITGITLPVDGGYTAR